uniref:Small ribosomal subunit protein uS2c n=1 Tax=Mesostigma viride TaxID=41882 RepID=RR2_MESVI|nr:ribosomal protein S2 [Mesostigma viride]Q9MUS8.1 RecName: Full=Small ribosomal subunit protein uS2c; AltName: Full=30S ribosomal protein S2, chloroplastic [Mesostigma viride]AAF43823.1 ribosomal protein S2 [Mesostigma viride]WKT08235.1 ribosomal protein S2 [Mesostigma viride]WKT08341.1 ribosomal protein S2 [Mesostigma viride]
MKSVGLEEMMEAGVHFGHQTRGWNPKMSSYIYGNRNGIHLIDLVQTARLLSEACDFLFNAAKEGKEFLFVGTKSQASDIIASEALRAESHYVNQRWLGGMLTNWSTIKTRIRKLKDLEQKEKNGILDTLPKKEAAVLKRQLYKLRKYLSGLQDMKYLPDVVIIVDQKREINAVKECIKLGIPTISLVDTNCDPTLADLPIPANDDAIRSINLLVSKLADAIYEGQRVK